jgi:hypothetical protein
VGNKYSIASIHSSTRYGVYVVVFNMERLCSDDAKRGECLAYLSFWINSVAVQTRQCKQIAPLFLVGTYKDKIGAAAEHSRLSDLLRSTFCNAKAWPHIREYTDEQDSAASLTFLPVDNQLGMRDIVLQKLLTLAEECITTSDYLKISRPLSWFKFLDKLVSAGDTCVLTLVTAGLLAMNVD